MARDLGQRLAGDRQELFAQRFDPGHGSNSLLEGADGRAGAAAVAGLAACPDVEPHRAPDQVGHMKSGRLENDRPIRREAPAHDEQGAVSPGFLLNHDVGRNIPAGPEPEVTECPEDQPEDGNLALGIAGAAPEDRPVFDPGPESIGLTRRRRDDVHVRVQSQAFSASGSGQPDPDVCQA